MKSFKLIILPVFAIGILFGFASCEKETNNNSNQSNGETNLIIRPFADQNRVGEEEEEEIIAGKLEDLNELPIANATILLLNSSDTTIVDSDVTSQTGTFELSAVDGNYFFQINNGTSSPVFTNSFQLTQNIQVVIQI